MLESEEFSKIAKETILFYNDYYQNGGKEPCKTYEIRWFPTVKLINKKGEGISSLVGPRFDAELYLKWIKLAEKGITEKTALSLAKSGKLSLEDARDFAYVFSGNPSIALRVLENVLNGYEGYDYKNYAFTISEFVNALTGARFVYGEKIKEKTGKTFKDFTKECEFFIRKLEKAGAPSVWVNLAKLKKKYFLDKKIGEFSKAETVLKSPHFSEIHANAPDIVGLCAYIYSKKKGEKEGLDILLKLKPGVKGNFGDFKTFFIALETAGESANLDGNPGFAKKCGEIMLDVFDNITKKKPGLYYVFLGILQRYDAKTKAITLPLAEKLIERVKAKPSDTSFYNKVIAVYLQGERKDKAIQFLKTYVDTPKFMKLSGEQNFAREVNSFCWTFVRFGQTDSYLIGLMEKSLKIDKNPASLDTLANLYALQGNYKKAIETEKEAVEILKKQNAPERKLKPYLQLIEKWEKMLSGK